MRNPVLVRPHKLGERILLARHRAGLSQRKLAERAGVTRAHLAHVEAGASWPSVYVFMRLCRALRASADWLLFGRGHETPE